MKLASSAILFACIAMLTLSLTSSAQNDDQLAYCQTVMEDKSDLIIDFNVKGGSYPTMEEEMSIYLKLREDTPQAFFFPNPSNGILWIEHNLGSNTTLIIKDRSGKPIFTAHDLRANKLDLTDFKEGSYLLVLKGSKGEVTRSITVK